MKMFTSSEQTTKLIELGFREPKSKVGGRVIYEPDADLEIEWEKAYSIGELMEMLDCVDETVHCRFGGVKANLVSTNSGYEKIGGELIDLLFDLCVKLKEGGVI